MALARDVLARGLRARLRVRGASMAPAIRDGDTVVLAPVAGPGGPRIGDVVLFRSRHGAVLLHRLVRRPRGTGGARRLQMLGDALPRFDDAVDRDRVLAKVVRIERRGAGAVDTTRPAPRLAGALRAARGVFRAWWSARRARPSPPLRGPPHG